MLRQKLGPTSESYSTDLSEEIHVEGNREGDCWCGLDTQEHVPEEEPGCITSFPSVTGGIRALVFFSSLIEDACHMRARKKGKKIVTEEERGWGLQMLQSLAFIKRS